MTEPGPVRATLRRRKLALVAVALGWLALQISFWGLRADLHSLAWGYALGLIALPIAAAVALTAAAGAPGRFGLGLRAPGLIALSAAGALWPVLAGLALEPPAGHAETLQGHLRCFGLVTLVGAPLLAAGGFAHARAFAAVSQRQTALLGAAAGLLGVAVATLHCQVTTTFHVAWMHGVPVSVLALAAALVVERRTRI